MSEANFIVVGGPISVGKSTLVTTLPFIQVPELDNDDEILMLLLENTYSKERVSAEVIETYFLELRKQKYIDFSNSLTTHVFDRSIFESLWFAKGNMDSKSYKHFERLWEKEIIDLIKEYGKPKIYILLTMNWDTFKKRLFERGREVEVKNFQANEEFFKKHIKEYEDHMISVFKKFELKYINIKTDNKSAEDVLKTTLTELEVSNA